MTSSIAITAGAHSIQASLRSDLVRSEIFGFFSGAADAVPGARTASELTGGPPG